MERESDLEWIHKYRDAVGVPASSCGEDPTSYDEAYLSIPTKHCQLEVERG